MIKLQLNLYEKLVTLELRHYQYYAVLKFASDLFDTIVDTDFYCRLEYVESEDEALLKFIPHLKEDLQKWSQLTSFLLTKDAELWHAFDKLQELRNELVKRQDECLNWILKPAAELFSHEKFVELRDQALDQYLSEANDQKDPNK